MISGPEKNRQLFLHLLRAGLWERDIELTPWGEVDFKSLIKLANEQAVVGLVTAGIDHITDTRLEDSHALPFLKEVILLECRNTEMNQFIAELMGKLSGSGVYALLIKGQGVAQCYARPLWRSSGDVDLFLDSPNYQKSKSLLIPLATSYESEDVTRLHQAMTFGPWVVELHGTMRTEISSRVDRVIDSVQKDIFENSKVRTWRNGVTDVHLPDPDDDVVLIFTHFIKHLYVGGIGLRQVCDWCRLIWTYEDRIDRSLLEKRLNAMGLMPEWRVFASLAVDSLGMPCEAMPFYRESRCYSRRACRVRTLILDSGNFGHNKDESYRSLYPKLMVKAITFFRRLGEFARLTTIFPVNAPRFFVRYVFGRMKAV